MMKVNFPATGIMLAASLALTACQGQQPLSQAEAEAFETEIGPKVERALIGLSDGDYDLHTQDFDEELRERVDPISFPAVFDETIGVLGEYISHSLVEVRDARRYWVAVYDAQFQNDPHVTVRVIFWKSDPDRHISGLWLDSDLLGGNTR